MLEITKRQEEAAKFRKHIEALEYCIKNNIKISIKSLALTKSLS